MAGSIKEETRMSNWRTMLRPATVAICLCLLAACSQYDIFGKRRNIYYEQPSGQSFLSMQTTAGKVLATPAGMTLYTYDKDTQATSTCYGDCAEYWPPFLAGPGAKEADFLTLVPRNDGTKQWAANGKPLYTFVKDVRPGEVRGDNYNNVWHVVRVQ
jgi:predicted lipoprotein with Yx(FWY)xxD motif